MAPVDTIPITVEFRGGLEIFFADQVEYELSVPSIDLTTNAATTVGFLVTYLVENLMADKRKELFVVDGAVRPGILVLINGTDWELEGEDAYVLQPGDAVLFISTLHGG